MNNHYGDGDEADSDNIKNSHVRMPPGVSVCACMYICVCNSNKGWDTNQRVIKMPSTGVMILRAPCISSG